MKYAFTMIELIFVIIILGILAAVSIPKLAATRNDALASNMANELGSCISGAGGAYQMDNAFDTVSDACQAISVTTTCFTLNGDNATGILTVQDVPGHLAGSACLAAQVLVATNGLSSVGGIAHEF